jgi:hypothetical protein
MGMAPAWMTFSSTSGRRLKEWRRYINITSKTHDSVTQEVFCTYEAVILERTQSDSFLTGLTEKKQWPSISLITCCNGGQISLTCNLTDKSWWYQVRISALWWEYRCNHLDRLLYCQMYEWEVKPMDLVNAVVPYFAPMGQFKKLDCVELSIYNQNHSSNWKKGPLTSKGAIPSFSSCPINSSLPAVK